MSYRSKGEKIKRIARVLLIFFIARGVVLAQDADLVIVNAKIQTLDRTKPRAEALAIIKNRIAALGTNQEIRRLTGARTKTIDARGRLVLPGFNDAHVHFMAMGRQFFSVDLRGARSMRDVAEKVARHARFLPEGLWILGSGLNSADFPPDEPVSNKMLDEAAPAHPVFLYFAGGKAALVNSRALRAAGIERNAGAFNDDQIARDAMRVPTGVLKGAAVDFVRRFAPQYATDDLAAVAETAGNYAAAFGVTSVQDLSADDHTDVFRALARQGKLKTRVYDCAGLSDWRKLAQAGVKKAEGDAFVRRGCLKGMAEGDAEQTAWLYDEIAAADRAGLQITVHAIGARANEQILSVFERVVKTNGKKDRRFRVEHAHNFRAADIARFARSGIIASVQPFLFSDGAGRGFDPLRALVDNRTTLAFGSDSSIIPVDPLAGIAAAVNTSDAQQKLTVAEAVRFYTTGAAYAEFQETEKGTLAVGKLADLVILSEDIFAVESSEIAKTRVLTTIVDGRVVYEAD